MIRRYIIAKKTKLEDFLRENRMYAMPTILLVGFVVDTFTLNQIDQVFDNMILVAHILIIATTITLIFARDTKFGRKLKVTERESTISALMLFSFGGLFSGFVIFYSRSGSIISSWPFILLMLLLMLGTEVKKKYYQKLILQITIFYIGIFSYLIFSVPVVLKRMGPEIYVLSGVISFAVITLFLWGLSKINRAQIRALRSKLTIRIVSIFVIFNVLYFLNVIPPIPLSLKFRAVYHDFSRIQTVEYRGAYEETAWWNFWKKRSNVFHRRVGESVYVFSEVYAPIKLDVDIYHKWEYFDPLKTRWVPSTEVRIPITGGRADGFRGYSQKTNIDPGSWRVKITTDRDQTIGQIMFKIKEADGEPLDLKQEAF